MPAPVLSVNDYLAALPEDRRKGMQRLRTILRKKLPKGFREEMNYGMIGYVVPHALYPKGYHCKPSDPLPFMNIASQKNFIAVYHMGLYADPDLLKWFTQEFAKNSTKKLDMGKSCIRFKKVDEIPFQLIGALAAKMTPSQWIDLYEKHVRH